MLRFMCSDVGGYGWGWGFGGVYSLYVYALSYLLICPEGGIGIRCLIGCDIYTHAGFSASHRYMLT
jgi:hypothetical protein